MEKLWTEHRWWNLACFVFILAGMCLLFFIENGTVVVYFSLNRTPFLDNLFKAWTILAEEFSYLIIFAWLLYHKRIAASMVPLLGIIVFLVMISLKALFGHERPWNYFQRNDTLHDVIWMDGVEIIKGFNSFPSGHTLSAFALFGLLALVYANNKWVVGSCFIIAAGVGISRIYLGQHFLKDILFGAFCGTCISTVIYLWIYQKLQPRMMRLIPKRSSTR